MNVENYFEQVYAGVLGKVIGVYMGRPFEGWWRDALEKRWGVIDHYVHADQNVPLVVSDDDISGTFTFVKALADSGLYAETPADFFGDNWLNYLIENRTILWWGGVGYSTEHTAYARLKSGVRAPLSGSIEMNGRVVAEQIGAQIFIDAFGMVAPGNPELAIRLAEKAARVSHDGEAVIAAKVVAAMVSMAFTDKDIHSILDRVLALIPADSLIATLHREVRRWVREDGDWRKTYDRIKEKYGYEKFGGGCHVIPNHAIMVMAWEYAGNDFFEALKIINTAGWDTDCNAANVGSVCALITGLDRLDEKYGFHSHPEFADRLIIPTADGTDTITDCLQVARYITRLGCKISGIPLPVAAGSGIWHDFALHGALHGYIGSSPNTSIAYSPLSGGSAAISFTAYPQKPAVAETPVTHNALRTFKYTAISTPSIYHGMDLVAKLECDELDCPSADICLEVVSDMKDGNADEAVTFRSPAVSVAKGAKAEIKWRIDCEHRVIDALRIVISSPVLCHGVIRLVSLSRGGTAEVRTTADAFNGKQPRDVPGWICTFSQLGKWGRTFSCDEGQCVAVTGNRTWRKTSVACTLNTHCSDRAGVLLNYQGLLRHYAVVISHGHLEIIRTLYGETVLFRKAVSVAEDQDFRLEASVADGRVTVSLDGAAVADVRDDALTSGGAGIVVKCGSASLCGELAIDAVTGE